MLMELITATQSEPHAQFPATMIRNTSALERWELLIPATKLEHRAQSTANQPPTPCAKIKTEMTTVIQLDHLAQFTATLPLNNTALALQELLISATHSMILVQPTAIQRPKTCALITQVLNTATQMEHHAQSHAHQLNTCALVPQELILATQPNRHAQSTANQLKPCALILLALITATQTTHHAQFTAIGTMNIYALVLQELTTATHLTRLAQSTASQPPKQCALILRELITATQSEHHVQSTAIGPMNIYALVLQELLTGAARSIHHVQTLTVQ